MDATHIELLERFQRAQAQFTDRVDAVEAGRWDAVAVPGWTVLDLVAHLIGEQLRVPLLLAGETAASLGDRVPTGTEELVDGDPLGSWEVAADSALTAWAQPDAMARTVLPTTGPVPAGEYLEHVTADLTVHAWDLARATGGDTRLDPDLVAAALQVAGRRPGSGGPPGRVAPPLAMPDGGDPQTRLLAASGRRA